MLKKMIQGYLRQRQIEQTLLRKAKFEEIKKATEMFFIDLAIIKSEQILNEKIKCPADIDYYYNRLIKCKKLA